MASWVRGRHVRLQEALEPQQADRGDRYAVLEHGFASATLYLGDSEAARYSAATRQAQPMTSEPMSLGRHSSLARSTRFVPDSPVEGAGFEPSVPGAKEPVSFAEDELRGIERGRPTKVVSLRGTDGRIHLPPAGSPLRTWRRRHGLLMEALIRCTVEIKAPFSAAVLRMLTPAASFSGGRGAAVTRVFSCRSPIDCACRRL